MATFGGGMAVVHFLLVWGVLPKMLPSILSFYSSLKPKQQSSIANDLACCAHHIVVVPLSLYCLYVQAATPLDEQPDYTLMVPAVCMTFGYFAADFVVLLPQFLKGRGADFFVHHVAGMALVDIGLRNTFGARWVPWFLITEITTLVFTGCKILVKANMEDGPLYKVLAALFTVLFLVVRVILLPIASYWLTWGHATDAQLMGWRVVLPPVICALQFYWFKLIAEKVLPLVFMGGKGSDAKAVDPGLDDEEDTRKKD